MILSADKTCVQLTKTKNRWLAIACFVVFVSLHVNNVKRQERSEEVLEMGFVVRELMDILERTELGKFIINVSDIFQFMKRETHYGACARIAPQAKDSR